MMTSKPILLAAGMIAVVAIAAAFRPGPPSAEPSSVEPTMSNVIHLTTPAFPAVKAQPKPVLIDFWAPWCGPCRQQGPIVEQVSAQMGDQAIVAKVNVDEERALAAQYDVRAIPTLVVLRDGNVVGRFVGVTDASTLAGALRSARP